jgi:hypothetical protein
VLKAREVKLILNSISIQDITLTHKSKFLDSDTEILIDAFELRSSSFLQSSLIFLGDSVKNHIVTIVSCYILDTKFYDLSHALLVSSANSLLIANFTASLCELKDPSLIHASFTREDTVLEEIKVFDTHFENNSLHFQSRDFEVITSLIKFEMDSKRCHKKSAFVNLE